MINFLTQEKREEKREERERERERERENREREKISQQKRTDKWHAHGPFFYPTVERERTFNTYTNNTHA